MNHCPNCGHCLSDLHTNVDELLRRCADKSIRVLDGGLVSEEGAALLLGYSGADTLRKQVREHGGHVPYLMRGTRRLYSLEVLKDHVPA